MLFHLSPRVTKDLLCLILVALLLLFLIPYPALAQSAGPLGPSGEPLMQDDPPRVAAEGPLAQESMAAPSTSGDYRIDSLLSSYSWPARLTAITYSFYDNESFGGSYYGSETVSEVSEPVKANVRQIMAWYATIMNKDFIEVAETKSQIGYIRIMLSNGPRFAYAYYPTHTSLFSLSGDIHLSPAYDRTGDSNGFQNPPGSHGYMTLAHEIGHTLGLKHPHDGSPVLPANEDNTSNTIMSYDARGPSAGTPMPLDLLALQYLYGARPKWTGDDSYLVIRNLDQYQLGGSTYLDTPWSEKETIWDSGGFNVLDLSQMPYNGGGLRLDTRSIGWLTANSAYHGDAEPYFDYGIAIAEGVAIHDIVNSSSDDTIYANSSANTFRGYSSSRATGADVVHGATPADTVDLTLYTPAQVSQFQSGSDRVISLGGNGSITLKDYYLGPDNQPAIVLGSAQPSIGIADVSVSEGSSGATAATFTVSLSSPAAEDVSVAYSTADDTAVAAVDYVAASGVVNFPAGMATQQVTVQVLGDTAVEGDETFFVNLDGVTGNATIADGQAVGTIRDDDQPPVAPAAKIHVGDLDGSFVNGKKSLPADVTVTVHGPNEKPLAGAVITGSWSNGASGASTCTTGRKGTCTVSVGGLSRATSSVTFTVDKVSLSGYAYDASANHDVDGGSSGTTITLTR